MTINVEKYDDHIKIIFPNDKENKNLKLLVTLSPILIAAFDNGSYELEFLRKIIEKSKFPYGLYPKFFDDFDIDQYKKAYDLYEVKEDIYLNDENNVEFIINPLDDIYINGLVAVIEGVIINQKSNDYFTDYFKEMRDDIVINGRRSVLANGIQGFYLSKYAVVWMIDLCDYVLENFPDKKDDISPIYKLANNLKTPSLIDKQ